MISLPVEILIKIFQEVRGTDFEEYDDFEEQRPDPSLSDTARLALASKLFNEIATPLLYHHLDINRRIVGHNERHAALVTTLSDRPHLASLVVKLRVMTPGDESLDSSLLMEAREGFADAAEDVEALLELTTGLEQLIIDGVSARRNTSDSQSYLCFDIHSKWQRAFEPLSNYQKLSSLWLLGGIIPFRLPALPALVDLRTQLYRPSVMFSSRRNLPSLTSLSLLECDENYMEDLSEAVAGIICNLTDLDLRGSNIPLEFAAEIFARGKRLEKLSFDIEFQGPRGFQTRESTPPPSLLHYSAHHFSGDDNDGEGRQPDALLSPAPKTLEVELSISFYCQDRPSPWWIEVVRQLLFTIRRPKAVNIAVEWMSALARKEIDVFEGMKRVWKEEGCTVNVSSAQFGAICNKV